MKYNITKVSTRIGALIIDTIALGVLGFILGLAFNNFFVSVGSLGLLIGLLICIIYFTIGYSHITKGQTIGKRILKIQVIKKDDEYLTISESLIRAFILFTPFYLINLRIPGVDEASFLFILKGTVSFIAIIGIILLFLTNKANRQTLHDFLPKSYVTDIKTQDDLIELQKPKNSIFIIYGVLSILVLGFAIYNMSGSNTELSNITSTYEKINNIEGVINSSFSENTTTFYGDNKQVSHSISTTIWVKQLPNFDNLEDDIIVQKTIRTILNNTDNISDFDIISLKVVRGFNIGIAKSSRSHFMNLSPEEWKTKINQ